MMMNNHDIELPPLPQGEYRLSPDSRAPTLYDEEAMGAYARAAIEADRKRQPRADTETLQQLNEVLQYLENEVMKLEAAYGHNFKPHATKKARATVEKLKAAMYTISKRRGDPVAWLYEDELPDNYPYDTMFPYSKVYGVRMFPVYAPQPAEPVKGPSDDLISRLRVLAQYKHDDVSVADEAADALMSGQPAASAEHATLNLQPSASMQPIATAFFTEKGEVAYTGLFDRTLKALEAVRTTRMGISAGSINLYAAPVAARAAKEAK